MLGTGRRITINKETTTIVAEGNEQAVNARCDQIKKQMDETDASYDKEKSMINLLKHGHWGPWDLNDDLREGKQL